MAFITPTPVALSRQNALSTSKRVSFPAARHAPRPALLRMVATEPATTTTTLSLKARELLSYVRGHKSIFHPGDGFTATHCALFRKNDTGRCFTPLVELATNAHMLPAGSVAAMMVVQEDSLVETAVEAVFEKYPMLRDDETLLEIVSFDLRYLLRVISYGAACQSTDFIHTNNIGMMKMLHEEVGFPVNADQIGLNAARKAVLSQSDSAFLDTTTACFDVVINHLS